jgi:hypothetical protein
MIMDAEGQFSNAQAITVTAKSTNTIDQGPSKQGTSNGAPDVEILLHVTETFTAAGAGTLTIQVRTSATENMASPEIHDQSDALALSDLVAGNKIRFQPRFPIDAKRYLDLNYVVATGPMTAGKISATVVAARQTQR